MDIHKLAATSGLASVATALPDPGSLPEQQIVTLVIGVVTLILEAISLWRRRSKPKA